MNGSPGMALACILKRVPGCFRTPHVIVTIELAYSYGYADRLWTRCDAVYLAMQHAFECVESSGHGNRARRRMEVERIRARLQHAVDHLKTL